jgi:hypothetical protein
MSSPDITFQQSTNYTGLNFEPHKGTNSFLAIALLSYYMIIIHLSRTILYFLETNFIEPKIISDNKLLLIVEQFQY